MNSMARKQLEARKSERLQHLGRIAELEATANRTAQQEHELIACKAQVTLIEAQLAEAQKIESELRLIQTKQLNKSQEDIVVDLIEKYKIGYLVEDNKFIYCVQFQNSQVTGVINPQFRTVEASRIVPVLNKMSGQILQTNPDNMIKLFQVHKHDYYGMTGSFNDDKWNPKLVYNKMSIIRDYWVQPDFDGYAAHGHDSDFDFLMYTVGGGKAENIDHLEQWIAYKWLYPEKNANMPNLDIGGSPGGNGKGRYVELLKTIFTHGCVVPAAKKELEDGFNATWETAVILYYDEPSQNELPHDKLKKVTGGEEQRIERKGVDAYVADRNFNLVFTSNNTNGAAKLTGTGSTSEDRRWSVVTTDLVMVDEIMNAFGCDVEQAKVRTNEINNKIKDRALVARWLAHIIIKHNIANIEVLQPLHGADYRARFQNQKDQLTLIFDEMWPIITQWGCAPVNVITQLANLWSGDKKYAPKGIRTRFENYLKTQRVPYTTEKLRYRILWDGSSIGCESGQGSVFLCGASTTGTIDIEWNLVSTRPWNKVLDIADIKLSV